MSGFPPIGTPQLALDISRVNVVDFCGQTIRGDGMIVNSHQESKKYYFVTMGTDCHLTMQATSPKDKVQFHFRFFLVYSLLRVAPLSPTPLFPESPRGSASLNPRLEPIPAEGQGDPCHAGSYIQFYDGQSRSSPPIGPPLCGKSPPRPVLSTGNYLTLRLVTRGTQPRVDFVGDFTSFRLEPYFTCRNGKCIPLSLVCDDKGIDNCGDGSDLEENLTTGCKDIPNPISLLALYIILGIVAGAVVLCWCCWSPGWFLWRISICRFLPCCNSACASCQLCGRSCVHSKEHRPAKVAPHTPVNGAPVNGVVTTTANTNASDTAAVV
ncbi:low-density lipoprotein receptor class A domain-containing protein 2 [Lampris incognitus]|uniref:low-density lipoprotein receptor class A domain-containing protein 2 n=1 Tax=Lampris incognitus TaxID=2546036 RepID=UPI0024B63419|nr:low-density lipoprotein receptor class A domain-containing protein 2 [Lampris incognitus]